MSMQIDCLIVDDEPIARDILIKFCAHVPCLHVVGVSSNALEAKLLIENNKVDLLFLDIHLPVLNGLQFLRTLKNPPEVIFTTAYQQYAVEAFDLTACDYLVKPFLLERFIIAVDKARDKIATTKNEFQGTDVPGSIFVRSEGKVFRIIFSDLLYAEANGNYTKLVCHAQTIMPNMSFTSVEKLLPPTVFKRVHRSFIINKTFITLIDGNRVFLGSKEVPIGTNYREEFLKSLGL